MNVIPTFPLKNLHDAVLAYAAFSGKLTGWFRWVLGPDFKDKFWSQLGFIVGCSKSRRTPLGSTFSNFVMHIIGVSSEKKMGWLNARRVVASVENAGVIRDCAVHQNPSQPVSQHSFRFASAKTDGAVTKLSFSSSPDPAFFGLVNISPEPIRNRFRTSQIGKMFDWVKLRRWPTDSSFNFHRVIVDTNSRSVNTNG